MSAPEAGSRARARDERGSAATERIGWGGCGRLVSGYRGSSRLHDHQRRIESAREGVAENCVRVPWVVSVTRSPKTHASESAGEGVAQLVSGCRGSSRSHSHQRRMRSNRPGRGWPIGVRLLQVVSVPRPLSRAYGIDRGERDHVVSSYRAVVFGHVFRPMRSTWERVDGKHPSVTASSWPHPPRPIPYTGGEPVTNPAPGTRTPIGHVLPSRFYTFVVAVL